MPILRLPVHDRCGRSRSLTRVRCCGRRCVRRSCRVRVDDRRGTVVIRLRLQSTPSTSLQQSFSVSRFDHAITYISSRAGDFQRLVPLFIRFTRRRPIPRCSVLNPNPIRHSIAKLRGTNNHRARSTLQCADRPHPRSMEHRVLRTRLPRLLSNKRHGLPHSR